MFRKLGHTVAAALGLSLVLACIVAVGPAGATHLTSVSLNSTLVTQGTAFATLTGNVNALCDDGSAYGWDATTSFGSIFPSFQDAGGTVNTPITVTVPSGMFPAGIYAVSVTVTWRDGACQAGGGGGPTSTVATANLVIAPPTSVSATGLYAKVGTVPGPYVNGAPRVTRNTVGSSQYFGASIGLPSLLQCNLTPSSCIVKIGGLNGNVSMAQVAGPAYRVDSAANATNVLAVGGGIKADAVNAACNATTFGSRGGSTTFSNLKIGSAAGASNPAPNTTITIPAGTSTPLAKVVFNEQTASGATLTVNGLHVYGLSGLYVGVNLIISQATCTA